MSIFPQFRLSGEDEQRMRAAMESNREGGGKASMAIYDDLAERHPENPRIFSARARCRYHNGDFPGALVDYERAIALFPEAPAAIYMRGRTKRQLGDLDGALADYAQVMEMEGPQADTCNEIAELLEERGDFAGAKVSYEAALAKDPHWPEAQKGLRRVMAKLG
jgi:tetratricopeptide (TPR) repeat protein